MGEPAKGARDATNPKWFVAALFLLSMLAQKCGPAEAEAATAVLITAPIVYLIGLGLLAIFRWAWRPLTRVPDFPGRASWVTFFVLVLFSLLALSLGEKGGLEWAGVALVVFGTSYLSLLLLAFRIFVRKNAEIAFKKAPIAVMTILLLLAPVITWMSPPKDFSGAVIGVLWIAPGLFGQTTVPIAALLLLEVVVRRVRQDNSTPRD